MQKNKLNLHIYGIHLLNPYKTVVSHLNFEIIIFCQNLKTYFKCRAFYSNWMSLSQIALRTRDVLGNFEKRVPAYVNQERKTINNNLVLDYYVGSTFPTHSHKKEPRKVRKLSANSKFLPSFMRCCNKFHAQFKYEVSPTSVSYKYIDT